MDQDYDQSSRKPFIILVISVLVAFAVGIVLGNSLSSSKTSQQVSTESANSCPIVEEQSPVDFALLENPMIYEWRFAVAGKVTDKKDSYITLEKDAMIMKLFYLDNYTVIRDTQKTYTFDELPLGTEITGNVLVRRKEMKRQLKDEDLVAEFFTFVE